MALNRARLLLNALRDAGVPAIGLRMPDPADRATWRVDYARTATQADRDKADALIGTWLPAQAEADALRAAWLTRSPFEETLIRWLALHLNLDLRDAQDELFTIYQTVRSRPDVPDSQ